MLADMDPLQRRQFLQANSDLGGSGGGLLGSGPGGMPNPFDNTDNMFGQPKKDIPASFDDARAQLKVTRPNNYTRFWLNSPFIHHYSNNYFVR